MSRLNSRDALNNLDLRIKPKEYIFYKDIKEEILAEIREMEQLEEKELTKYF